MQWLLVMPSRYLLLAYFSSSAGFINALQALYMNYYDVDNLETRYRSTATCKGCRSSLSPLLVPWLAAFYLVAMLVLFMPYLIVFAPFHDNESAGNQDWIRNDHLRWYMLLAPVTVTTIAFLGSRRYHPHHYVLVPHNTGD